MKQDNCQSIDLLEASGVVESMRTYKGKIFSLDEHINRLFESSKSCGIQIKISKGKLKKDIQKAFLKSGLKDAFIRLTLREGQRQDDMNIIIRRPKTYPDKFYKDGIRVMTVLTKRNFINSQNPKVKSTDFLNGVLAILEKDATKDIIEVILLNDEGLVTEGTVANIFIVKGGAIITPPGYVGVLEGITRNSVIRLAKETKIEVKEIPFTRHDIYNAEEVFLTNTSMGVMPVVEVDSRKIKDASPGEITKQLMTNFKKLMEGAIKC